MASSAQNMERLIQARRYLLPILSLLSCTILCLSFAYAINPANSTSTLSTMGSISGRSSIVYTSSAVLPAHPLLFKRAPIVIPTSDPRANQNSSTTTTTTTTATSSQTISYNMPTVYSIAIPLLSSLYSSVELGMFWATSGAAKKTKMTTVGARRASFFFSALFALEWTAIAGIWTACELTPSTAVICPTQLGDYGILAARRDMATGKDTLAWIVAAVFAVYATFSVMSLGCDLGYTQKLDEAAALSAAAAAPHARSRVHEWMARSWVYQSMTRTQPEQELELELEKGEEHFYTNVSFDDAGVLRSGQKFPSRNRALVASRVPA